MFGAFRRSAMVGRGRARVRTPRQIHRLFLSDRGGGGVSISAGNAPRPSGPQRGNHPRFSISGGGGCQSLRRQEPRPSGPTYTNFGKINYFGQHTISRRFVPLVCEKGGTGRGRAMRWRWGRTQAGWIGARCGWQSGCFGGFCRDFWIVLSGIGVRRAIQGIVGECLRRRPGVPDDLGWLRRSARLCDFLKSENYAGLS